jgi:hypothetical protein
MAPDQQDKHGRNHGQSNRGFTSVDPERQRKGSSQGGQAAPSGGNVPSPGPASDAEDGCDPDDADSA